jgi:hypothetical protein
MPEKARDSPVHRLPDWRLTLPLAQSCPRCGARTRSGEKCKAPAMSNSRCRMHGGKGFEDMEGPLALAPERIGTCVVCEPICGAQMG